MFKEEYILELLSGHLTMQGYNSIISTIGSMARHFNWPKNIIVSSSSDMNWNSDDIKELAHQFFEWIIAKNKLAYVEKIPYEYLSFYFTQMLVSFVSNRIKEEQQKIGISFQKCQELVFEICSEDYTIAEVSGQKYVIVNQESMGIQISDLSNAVKYLPAYVIKPTTKHYKPIIRMAVHDVLSDINGMVSAVLLVKTIYGLLDQSSLIKEQITATEDFDDIYNEDKYIPYVSSILTNVSKIEAKMYLEYIFEDGGKKSLAEISSKYGLPKSTAHKKIEEFKHRIFSTYMPENESDGEMFLKKLALSLDEIAN